MRAEQHLNGTSSDLRIDAVGNQGKEVGDLPE